ncbi:thioredoxin-disulfide reductase [Buchnera aphidicola]|uniref:thioredoxin-disulfide reductase n=1 Tax=Buchnera aphidicola TaxID=9 RepID=UPI003CC86B8C
MKMKKKKKVLILGSGPSGYTSALYLARANLNPILITGNLVGGQLTQTNNIENWPGSYKKLTGFTLMKNMKKQILKFKVKIIMDHIKSVNFKKKPFELIGENKKKYFANSIILSTGSSPRFLNIALEKEYLGKGISTCAICDGFFYKNKEVAVIGGGNTAVEEALYLSKIAKSVHLVHRRKYFTAENILLKKLLNKVKKKKIFLYKNYIVKKILKNNNLISGILIQKYIKKNSKKKLKILINGIFIAIGNIPNTSLFKNQIDMKNNYIITKKYSKKYISQTNIKGIFAAGDVINNTYKQAIIASASGCIAALDAEKYLNSI